MARGGRAAEGRGAGRGGPQDSVANAVVPSHWQAASWGPACAESCLLSPACAVSRLQGDWHACCQHRAASAFTLAPLSPADEHHGRGRSSRPRTSPGQLERPPRHQLSTPRPGNSPMVRSRPADRNCEPGADAPRSERRRAEGSTPSPDHGTCSVSDFEGDGLPVAFCAPPVRPGFGDDAVRRPLNCRSQLNCHRALRALIDTLASRLTQ